MRVGLVACSATKLDRPARARDLYTSALFRKAARYCDVTYEHWYVLSARYGLVLPYRRLEPYDRKLTDLSPAERFGWAAGIADRLINEHGSGATFVFHAGEAYRRHLAERLPHTEIPLAGLRIGEQLAWYGRRCG